MTLQKAQVYLEELTQALTDDQREYLSWRVCGFTSLEASSRLGLGSNVIEAWKVSPQFTEIEEILMRQLRKDFALEMEQIEGMKLSKRIQALKAKVIDSALDGIELLSDNETRILDSVLKQSDRGLKAVLGETSDKPLPQNWDEAILLYRRNNDAGRSNESQESNNQESIIEAEYQESSDQPPRKKRRNEKKDGQINRSGH